MPTFSLCLRNVFKHKKNWKNLLKKKLKNVKKCPSKKSCFCPSVKFICQQNKLRLFGTKKVHFYFCWKANFKRNFIFYQEKEKFLFIKKNVWPKKEKKNTIITWIGVNCLEKSEIVCYQKTIILLNREKPQRSSQRSVGCRSMCRLNGFLFVS